MVFGKLWSITRPYYMMLNIWTGVVFRQVLEIDLELIVSWIMEEIRLLHESHETSCYVTNAGSSDQVSDWTFILAVINLRSKIFDLKFIGNYLVAGFILCHSPGMHCNLMPSSDAFLMDSNPEKICQLLLYRNRTRLSSKTIRSCSVYLIEKYAKSSQ